MIKSVFSSINTKLLPIKAHYFLFNIGIGPLTTNLPIIARQKGLSSTVVGIMLTVFFLLATIAKPIFGWLGDHFKIHKLLFITMQGVVAIAFFTIFFIPPILNEVKIKNLNNNTEIYFCPKDPIWDNCLYKRIEQYKSKTVKCQLNCKPENWITNIFCSNFEEMDCASNFNFYKSEMRLNLTTISINSTCLSVREFIDNYTVNDYLTLVQNSSPNVELIELNCDITCEDEFLRSTLVNRNAIPDNEVVGKFEFWLFCGLLLMGYTGCFIVNFMADTICFELLGDDEENFGKQKMWDAIGSGVVSFIVGVVIDKTSGLSVFKNYTVVYFLCLVTVSLDMLCSIKLQSTHSKKSKNILLDVGKLFKSVRISTFFVWCCFCGFFSSIIFNFVFWYLEDLTDQIGQNDCGENYIKTLEGLDMFIQTCIGEIPFFFFSGHIIKKIGHINCMHLILAAFAIRMFYYSAISNPWLILPVEVLNGVTYALFSSTMPSYANIIALPGTEATLQGLVGALHEGVGFSSGNFAGGKLLNVVGGSNAFVIFGIMAVSVLTCHILIHALLRSFKQSNKKKSSEMPVE